MTTNRTLKSWMIGSTLALAVAVGFIGSVQAQYKPTGADGITASPRGRQALEESRRAGAPLSAKPMACVSCDDKLVARVDHSARGPNQSTDKVALHLCTTCVTTAKATGVGKAQVEVANHGCGGCGGAKK